MFDILKTKIMSPIAKKILSTIAALGIGGGVIFLALYGENMSVDMTGAERSGHSWQDSLTVVPTTGTPLGHKSASSTTEVVANELIAGYVAAQREKGAIPLSESELQNIVQSVSQKIESSDAPKRYSTKDLTVIVTNENSLATYKKEFSVLLEDFAKKNTTNELLPVAQALDDRDESKLAPLAENIANYRALTTGLLAMSVPASHSAFHIAILQGYADMLLGLMDMREIIADPARGIRGIAKYQEGAQILANIIATFNTKK